MPTFIEKLAFFVLHLNYKKKFHPIIKLRSNLEQIHLIAFFFLKKKKAKSLSECFLFLLLRQSLSRSFFYYLFFCI